MTPVVESNPVIFKPVPKSCSNLSVDSLVMLFLRLLVTTSPIGCLFAKETAAVGLDPLDGLAHGEQVPQGFVERREHEKIFWI